MATTIDPSTISGKLILKKVSGPGELIGETEIVIGDKIPNAVVVSGIQFDQPGDYVVSVTSTSPDVEPTQFKITVTQAPTIIGQDESRGKDDNTNISGTRPIIAQIDIPTIKIPPIQIQKDDNDQTNTLVTSSVGMLPFISWSGNPIQDRDILNLKLYHEGIVPKVRFSFVDSQNFIKTIGAPQADTKFDLFINARSNSLKSIHLKFKVENFKEVNGGLYNVIGTLDVSNLYRLYNGSMKGSSFEVLRQISKDMGLGFNSNITSTNDTMVWRFNGSKTFETITEIINYSYISDKSFMVGYIDFYYCFNYVDVEKESKRDNTSDVGIETGVDQKDDISKIVKLQLINEESMNKSAFYFESDKKLKNNATAVTKAVGNRTITKSYNRLNKTFEVFDVDSQTSDDNKTIILKGSKMDKEDFENSYTTQNNGKIDTDNTHSNYTYAYTQNRRNLIDLQKLELKIILPNTNFNLYKFQKVNVKVINAENSITNRERIEWRNSGDWIIADISFIFDGTHFYQEVRLVRKELGKTPAEINANEKLETKDPDKNAKVNENPAPTPVLPNSIYTISDIYRVKDKDNNEFLIYVKNLSDDGKSIVAQLTSIGTFAPTLSQEPSVTPVILKN
jgi:hypothetical protein